MLWWYYTSRFFLLWLGICTVCLLQAHKCTHVMASTTTAAAAAIVHNKPFICCCMWGGNNFILLRFAEHAMHKQRIANFIVHKTACITIESRSDVIQWFEIHSCFFSSATYTIFAVYKEHQSNRKRNFQAS